MVAYVLSGCGGEEPTAAPATDENVTTDTPAGLADPATDIVADATPVPTPDPTPVDKASADSTAAAEVETAKTAPAYAKYFPKGAAVAVVIQPRRLLESELISELPLEEPLAKIEDRSGLDPKSIERVVLAIAPPAEIDGRREPDFAVIVSFTEPVDLRVVLEKAGFRGNLEEKSHNDASYLVTEPRGPGRAPIAALALDDDSYVLTPEPLLHEILERNAIEGPLAAQLAKTNLTHEFVLVGTMEGQDSLLEQLSAIAQSGEVPPMLAPLLSVPQKLLAVTLTIGLSGENLLAVKLDARDEEGGKLLKSLADLGKTSLEGLYEQQKPQLAAQPPLAELAEKLIAGLNVSHEGTQVRFEVKTPPGGDVIAKALRSAIEAARTAAKLSSEKNDLRQIGLAFHNYHNLQESFPVAGKDSNSFGKDGEPFMSWRTHILPFMDQAALYNTLNLGESADSDHNKPLLEKAENPYLSLNDAEDSKKTRFRMFSGKGTLLPGGKGLGFRDITDGASNTIMAIQVGPEKAVTWYKTKTGIPIDSKNLLDEIGNPGPNGYLTLFCDGAVRPLPADITAEQLKDYVTINGGEVVR